MSANALSMIVLFLIFLVRSNTYTLLNILMHIYYTTVQSCSLYIYMLEFQMSTSNWTCLWVGKKLYYVQNYSEDKYIVNYTATNFVLVQWFGNKFDMLTITFYLICAILAAKDELYAFQNLEILHQPQRAWRVWLGSI